MELYLWQDRVCLRSYLKAEKKRGVRIDRYMDIEKEREKERKREKKMYYGILPMAGHRGESERKIFFYPNKNIYDYL